MIHDLPTGTLIDGRYRVVRHLGAGGFADVFEAVHVQIDRPVALKLLQIPAHLLGDATFEERFRQEAAIAAKIDHPNVVRVYDFGVHVPAQAPYIAMELLHGEDLSDLIEREGGLPTARALALFLQALDALGKAHSLNIVHKDLKPSNLFVVHPGTGDEALRVVDFGIARLLDERDGQKLTQTGQMVGTPQYLAPEYISTTTALPATDVYQMGLILIELLTGRVAVEGNNSLHCLILHSSGDITVPEALRDSPLGPIVAKAIALDPNARYPTAAEFAAALRQLDLGGLPARFAQSGSPLAFDATDTLDPAPPRATSGALEGPDTIPPTSWGRRAGAGATEAAAPSTPTPARVPVLASTPTPRSASTPTPPATPPPSPPAVKTALEPVAAPEPPPDPPTRASSLLPIGLAVGAVGAVGAAALLAVFLLVAGGAEEPPPTEPPPPPSAVDAAPAAPPSDPPPAPAPATVRLGITSDPSGAGIFAGDIKLGATPWTWERPQDDLPVTLTLRLEGYDDASVTLVPNADRAYHSALTQAPPATPTAATPADPPPAAPGPAAAAGVRSPPKTPAKPAPSAAATPADPPPVKPAPTPTPTPPAASPPAQDAPGSANTASTTRGRRMGKMN